ncbi:MAG TPA: adenylate/guanylate cyclase domain-containing protein [Solirubrobacterales bacterium]|jgi:adenylate cyclase|nr:adenylate/guanylate cyclase domain-containing protein [Solirubrobacterales bacterium]
MPGIGNDDGERKQVTVLFADVSGSMDLAEGQDPEEWRKVMQRFFAILAAAVERFEGTVDKFTGDGIMAVFGAPVTHEDHARRACYSALQMLDDVAEYAAELRRGSGLNFSTRIGINSGEVVAGAIGAGGEGEYTAIGHTVGLAQRMEALAEPGKAYLTESTAALATGFLELGALGEFEIKGASQPVDVFELVGLGAARSRLDLSRERGFSRFVGRDEEMAALDAALGRAEAGEGAVVGIVAEPGVGKSRLSYEFGQRCRERGIEIFEAQAQSHGQTIPFMPVLQMLRAYFGIGDREPERLTREKIAGRTLLLDPGFADDLPLLFDFLGVPDPERPVPQMSAEARQRALAGIVCKLVNAPNRRHTLALVVEDLHWLDGGSAAMLAELVGAVVGTKTLVVVNFRPEYSLDWDGSPIYEGISLQPLGQADTRELLRDIAGEDPSLDGLEGPIHERTAGNPFFVEEIVRELVEAGHLEGERGAYRLVRPVEETGVPATVQAVLGARIDRLAPDAKLLLQVGSVVGREVGARALGMTAGLDEEELNPALCELVDGGFLYEAELYPERVLAFRHPLTREVAYGTQLTERRAATHAAAAEAMIALEPDRLDELAALVAHHLEAGGRALEAARWSARAAHWAGHTRPQDAMRLWQRVTALVAGLEEDEEVTALAVFSRMLQLEYAWRLGMDRGEADLLAAEATEIAERSGDVHSLALLKLLTTATPGRAEHSGEWIAAAEEAIELADSTGDPALRIAVRSGSAYAFMCAGDLDSLERTADTMLELTGADPTLGAGIVVDCPIAWALMAKAVALRERDRPLEAEELLDRALRLSEEHDDPETAGWVRGSKSLLLADRGETEAALALARRNRELTERLGDVFSLSTALASMAYVELAAGRHEDALETIQLADRLYREAMGAGGETEAWRSTLRARALLGLGRNADALEEAEWAAGTAERRGMGWQIPVAFHTVAQARAAARAAGIEEALDEATEAATSRGHLMTLGRIEADREALRATAR